MFTDKLMTGQAPGDEAQEIARVDQYYADVPDYLKGKPDDCVFLAMSDAGLSFFYNFDDRARIVDFLGMFTIAAHSIAEELEGRDRADALLARVLAECIGGTD
jgi:hypothetical protein